MYKRQCIYSKQKSFGGKAKIREEDNSKTLVSYNTDIIKVSNGEIKSLYDGWTQTTGKHIKEFFKQFYDVDVNKKTFEKIQAGEITNISKLRGETIS